MTITYHAKLATHIASCVLGVLLLLSGLYVLFGFYSWTVAVSAMLVVMVGWVTRPCPRSSIARQPDEIPRLSHDVRLVVVMWFLMEAVLVSLLVYGRTATAIVSPWQVISPAAFVFFFLTTVLLFMVWTFLPRRLAIMMATIHVGVMWGVSAIIFPYGFGYDPFVHQATEQHILTQGVILPKQPMYVGQYVLVDLLALLTHLPIAWIDRLLVPILATLVLPALAWRSSRSTVLALFLLPIASFTFTIPFHLGVICLASILLLLREDPDRRTHILLWLLALFACACHPLTGIPALAIVLGSALFRRWPSWVTMMLVVCTIPAGFLAAMYAYGLLHHTQTVVFSWDRAVTAWRVLAHYPFRLDGAPWSLALLYRFHYWYPYAFVVIGCLGYWMRDRLRSAASRVTVAVALGSLASAFVLAAFVRLPDIIAQEQFEFALRLRTLTPLYFLSGVGVMVATVYERVRAWKYRIPLALTVAILATATWFLLYPQHNRVLHVYAANMGWTDVETVRLIEREAKGERYVVLAPQLISAAALQAFGFERRWQMCGGDQYFYPIPTGGELYRLYLMMTRSPAPQQLLPRIFDCAKTQMLFVAVLRAWDASGVMDRALAPHAEGRWSVGDRVTVYRFQRHRQVP
ncbi:MAG: hypothetical protein WCV84_05795 [Patescibacteria group bacterium]